MTIQEAIEARHSVRAYKDLPLSEEIVKLLEDELVKLNNEGQLHIQLICNEPKAFKGTMAKYGITLNRGPHSGPIKKWNERKNPIIKEDKQ